MNAVIADKGAWRHTLATITDCVTTATITGEGCLLKNKFATLIARHCGRYLAAILNV